MDISSISTNYTVANADKSTEQGNSIQSSLKNISSDSSEEQLKGVIKDFESYFVEEVIKEVKKNLLPDDEEKDASLSTMTDYTMDFAVEKIADELIDQVGGNFTQSLYEQMKRNYNID